MPELDWSEMPKHLAIKNDWTTPELLIEGSLNCGKTTVWLDKEIDALFRYPGIRSLMFRWSQDSVETKLRVAFEEVLKIRNITEWTWEDKPKRYVFANESIVYMFGLKTVSTIEIMSKIRGLGVSRISGDQAEEIDPSVGGELRGRTRPGLTETVITKTRFPYQVTFVSNSEDDDFWLSKEFPVDNHIKGRKVFQLSVFDNKWLPQESIDNLLRQYPEDHPRHRTMVLGKRGPRVFGVPVFEGLYSRQLHWTKAREFNPDVPIVESFEYGKHNPAWICAQLQYSGGMVVMGGVFGLGLILKDFLTIADSCRKAWYPAGATVKTCASPMGGGLSPGDRFTLTDVLRKKLKLKPTQPDMRDDANAPDVRLAMIENLSDYLKGRNATGQESFAVNTDESKFIIASRDGQRFSPFVHHAFEGGYSWDAHEKSVGNKQVRIPREDDKFANIMHALENIELNYCSDRPTYAEVAEREKAQARNEALNRGPDNFSPHVWMGY